MGTAGEDGHEIFRWRVMLRKGRLPLPQNAHRSQKSGEGGGAAGPDHTKLHQQKELLLSRRRAGTPPHTDNMDRNLCSETFSSELLSSSNRFRFSKVGSCCEQPEA